MSLPRAFAALSGATMFSMAAQLVRGKLAAIVLGPAGVGIFNQLSLMWNLFSVAGSLGSFNGIVQHGAEALANDDRDALQRLASTFTLLIGVVACLLAAIGVILAPTLSDWLLHDRGAHGDLVALILLAIPIGVTAQTYRALLSAARAVKRLVYSQILSDLGGAVMFAILIVPLGLRGAILGFMASHLLLLLGTAVGIRRDMEPGLLRPRLSHFNWGVVGSNVGFGASGLLLMALSSFSVLVVSRLIIDHLGVDANGIFSNAWRIASVYLGGVTAATIGYYLPTLTRCPTDAEMGREVNATLRFYLIALPLVMVGVMAGGELLVWLVLSRQFLPVAPLLLLFVPAELARILGDTVIAEFMARRRLRPFTILYVGQFSLASVTTRCGGECIGAF